MHSDLIRILKRLSRRAGVKLNIEPRYGFVGQVVRKDGRKRYFRDTNFDVNSSGAYKIAKDKAYTAYFLERMGYTVIPGETFYSKDFAKTIKEDRTAAAAGRYAKQIGFPVIVKPNSLGRGAGVAKAGNLRELQAAIKAITERSDVYLVQPFIKGRDYRVVVFDGRLEAAYERLPLTVTGNGRFPVRMLLANKLKELRRRGRHVSLAMNDPRIALTLRRMKMSMRTVPGKGEVLELLSNRNLSSGGEAVDVTKEIHPSFRKLAVAAARDMNLRLAGVDLLVQGDIARPVKSYRIIEVNASPGFEHYASLGRAERERVNGLYLRILRALAKPY